MKCKHIRTGIVLGSLCFSLPVSNVSGATGGESPRVYRDKIEPHWFADASGLTNQFWYALELAGGEKQFILVDADRGTRHPAFDHERLAGALAKSTGESVDAKQLPFDSVSFSPDLKTVTLEGRDATWEVDLTDYTVTARHPVDEEANVLPAELEIRPSRGTGEETRIKFVNHLTQAVDLFWLDEDANRQSYGSLEPGEERDQHTYAGHCWLVAAKNGDVIAVYEAQAKPRVALLRESTPTRPRRRSRAGRGARPPEQTVSSPDQKLEVFVRGHNLFLRDKAGGSEQQLTYDANPDSSYARNAEATRAIDMEYQTRDPERPTPQVFWSPDSRRVVAMRFQSGTDRRVYMVESSPSDQLQPRLVSIPYLKPGDQVPYAKPHLFDAEAKTEIPLDDTLFEDPWSINDVRWSHDSSRFTFVFNQRGHQVMRVLSVDAATGDVSPIVDEESDTFVCYASKFYVEYLEDTDEIIWMSERDGWNHLYLYDAKSGVVKNQITKGDWVVRGVERVDPEKRQIWFRAGGVYPERDPYYVHYCRVNFDGSGLTILTEGDGTHSAQFSPDNRFLIDTWSRVDLAPINELRRTDDGGLVCRLEAADTSELLAGNWRPPERFAAKGRDGTTDIYGVIFWPRDFDPGRRYPILEDVYAGPQDSFVPKQFRASYRNHDLTDRGFIVVQADGMGTSNRSKKFHDVCWKDLADAGFPDRILWIRAAAAKHPCMDLSRIGIYGTSAGGQSALRGMLDHGDFYKACVADSGCHDNRMDKIWWNEQWMGWPVDESYARSSNVTDADKLQGKLLLMVGELDRNVDPASTLQVVNALVKADKDFELLVMPGAGHGVARTPYGARRLAEFFTRTLLEQP